MPDPEQESSSETNPYQEEDGVIVSGPDGRFYVLKEQHLKYLEAVPNDRVHELKKLLAETKVNAVSYKLTPNDIRKIGPFFRCVNNNVHVFLHRDE